MAHLPVCLLLHIRLTHLQISASLAPVALCLLQPSQLPTQSATPYKVGPLSEYSSYHRIYSVSLSF